MTLITVQDGKVVLKDSKVGTEQACCCGGKECDPQNPDCPEGYLCCPQMIAIENGVATYENICLPLFKPEDDVFGRCCFNYGANCIDTYRADCLCSFDGLRGVEVTFTAGASCADGCENPFP